MDNHQIEHHLFQSVHYYHYSQPSSWHFLLQKYVRVLQAQLDSFLLGRRLALQVKQDAMSIEGGVILPRRSSPSRCPRARGRRS